MSRMSEMHLEIEERLACGELPQHIATSLKVPVEWVTAVEDSFECGYMPTADDYADADAVNYGTR